MAVTKTPVSVTIATGETSGYGVTSQITGELLAIIFVLPDNAPVGAQYQIYQTSPTIPLLEVSGQQIANRDDNLFNPRKFADSLDGQPIGAGSVPFPTTIPLHASIRMDISDALPGLYYAYLYHK